VASGILRGVTWDEVLEIARKNGLDARETCLTRHDFYSADECFMTNTSSGVLPVTALDSLRIADGKPGPVTKKLIGLFAINQKKSRKTR
jgi:branched-chain amino acid aminotransferase